MHFSESTGFGPLHWKSGKLAIVLLNSRKILQRTSRRRIPSPHVTEHGDHASAMNLNWKFLYSFLHFSFNFYHFLFSLQKGNVQFGKAVDFYWKFNKANNLKLIRRIIKLLLDLGKFLKFFNPSDFVSYFLDSIIYFTWI